jgi:radical SAM superfamily enzyme YgiQ (UPF0313 family)
MKVLIIQPAPPKPWPEGVYADEVARLGARLRETGHEPSLLVLADLDEEVLRLKIADVRPEHVVVYLESYHVALARRIAELITSRYYLPIIIGGPHATVAPLETLSIIGVEGVVLGEWDRAVPRYLEARSRGADFTATEGFWFKTETGTVRNPMAAPERPDEMVAVPDRRLYSADQVVDAAGRATLWPGRGCRSYCAHCQMDLAAGLYEERQMIFERRRPVAHLAREIAWLRATYPNLRRLRFSGCGFPLEEAYLKEFSAALAAAPLPFAARVKPADLGARAAGQLRQAGCDEVELEMLSGSEFIRNEIFNLDLSEEAIVRAFAAARGAGLRTTALVQVGLPYETVVTVEQTASLLRRLAPDRVEVRVYYPLPGTKAYELCRENGWLSGRGEADYFAGQSTLDLPGLDSGAIRRYATLIPRLVHRPKAWPLLWRLEHIRLGRRTAADILAPLLGWRRGRSS